MLALAGILPTARAGSEDTVILAAMRLSDEPNYRWVTTVVDDARTYEIHGQTAVHGYTHVKMPMVNSVRRRLGRSVTDTEIEAIFKGNVHCVLATDEGWKTVDELPEPTEGSYDAPPPNLLGGIFGAATPPPQRRIPTGYSNLQLGITPPHEDLGVIVTSHVDLRVDDEIATGRLTTLGAQLLLVRDGQHEITPLQATGTFKLWIRNGIVTRYQVHLDGVLSVASRSGRKQIRVRQDTDTTITAIGAADFEIPAEARRKLGA